MTQKPMSRISKVVSNAIMLADFVVNIDKYVHVWTMMAVAITKLTEALEARQPEVVPDVDQGVVDDLNALFMKINRNDTNKVN